MANHLMASMIASAVLASLTLPFFIFRLWIRIRMQRVGWEDIWATVAFVLGTINVVSGWVYVNQLSNDSSMVSMWIYMFTFTGLLWSVRISIIFSIIRVIPAGERLHTYGLTIAAFFLFICFAFLTEDAIRCSCTYDAFQPTPASPYFHCSLPRSSKIGELAVGCVADTVAVVFPLHVLRGVALSAKKHRLLSLLFSASLMVSIVCAARAACQLVPKLSSWSIVISNFQIAICLIVCNLVVIVTYLYRVLAHTREHDSTSDAAEPDSTVEKNDLHASSPRSEQMTLTTIEHLFSTQSGYSLSVVTGENMSKPVSAVGSAC